MHSQLHSSSSAGKPRTMMDSASTMCTAHSRSSPVRPISPFPLASILTLNSPLLLGHILLLPNLSPPHIHLRPPRRYPPPKPLSSPSASTTLPLLQHNRHLPLPRHNRLLGHPLLALQLHLHPVVQHLTTRPKLRFRAFRTRVHAHQSKSLDSPPVPHYPARLLLRSGLYHLRYKALLRLFVLEPESARPRGG